MSFSLLSSKFIAVSAILFVSHFATAQTRYNFFVGPQITTAKYNVRDIKQSTDFKFGFQLGVGAKIEFEKQLYFSPAVYYSYKGYKVTLNQAAAPPDLTAINNNTSIHTFETAFLLQYDFKNKPTHFFIKLGPSLDFQLYGKEKAELIDGSKINRSMKYGYIGYGRYAASAILQFGYEMSNNFFVYAHYAHGLSNLNNADAGPSIKHRVMGITVGKYFK